MTPERFRIVRDCPMLGVVAGDIVRLPSDPEGRATIHGVIPLPVGAVRTLLASCAEAVPVPADPPGVLPLRPRLTRQTG